MKVIDIIFNIIKYKPSDINKFINSFKSKGYTFERTFDLMNRNSFSPLKNFNHFYGPFGNKGFTNPHQICIKNLLNEKINNGNSQGPIDLLLVDKEKMKCIALTFKFFQSEKAKSFSKYDVSKMMTSPKEDVMKSFKNYKICFGIATNCKLNQIQSVIYRSKSKDSEYVSVLLTNPELNEYFNLFVKYICKNINQSIKDDNTKKDIIDFFESKKNEK